MGNVLHGRENRQQYTGSERVTRILPCYLGITRIKTRRQMSTDGPEKVYIESFNELRLRIIA